MTYGFRRVGRVSWGLALCAAATAASCGDSSSGDGAPGPAGGGGGPSSGGMSGGSGGSAGAAAGRGGKGAAGGMGGASTGNAGDAQGGAGEGGAGGPAGEGGAGEGGAAGTAGAAGGGGSGGGAICTPLETEPCYEGDPVTEGVGTCQSGTRSCLGDGSSWGPCNDQVLPIEEICSNGTDDDCDDATDESEDADGDGWGSCDGDCCQSDVDCVDPVLVNPGAYEIVANGFDDDCDGSTPDAVAPEECSNSSDFSVDAWQLAAAMELCQLADANPPLAGKKWGLISAELRNADGSVPAAARLSEMTSWQAAVLAGYGTAIVPQSGFTMVGMSTGRMRDAGDPGYVAPNMGTDWARAGNPPVAYLDQHNGALPTSLGCAGLCPAGSGANDSVNLRLTIRTPTNVSELRYRYRYFSSEYWSYTCTEYNDHHLALLTSSHPLIPADRNVAFDALNNPTSVNSGFFEVCQTKGCYACPYGVGDLAGTGMDADADPSGGLQRTGGGTRWLDVVVPVVPGETIVLDLMIFDVGDGIFDSVLLLDDFQWIP